MKKRVLIVEKICEAAQQHLKDQGYQVDMAPSHEYNAILGSIVDYDGMIVRAAPKITAEIMDAAPKLKVISRWGVGLDHIDVKAATERGIYITSTAVANYVSVAEQTVMMILATAKRLEESDKAIRKGIWNFRFDCLSTEVDGKTVGIIGLGRIGQHVAKMLHFGFNMNVVGYDPFVKQPPDYVKLVELDELYRQSDFVTLHMPANKDTIKMVNAQAFRLMKSTAYFVNVARGAIVDEAALVDALLKKEIAGAGLDVFEVEPAKTDNPLFKMDNVIVTPHYAGATIEADHRMGMHAVQGVHEVLSGTKPSWPVNKPELK
jgi:D-3-phosphoglycerate dehydrogenase